MLHVKIRRWVLVAAVVGLIGAWPGTAQADSSTSSPTVGKPATFTQSGLTIKRLTAAVQMTKDAKAARAYTGPTSMLADPGNPRVIVAASADLRTRICYLIRSTDAGHTWHILPAVPALSTYSNCTSGDAGVAQAYLAWGRNDTLYYGLSGYAGSEGVTGMVNGHGAASILLAKSTNLGNSWSTTVVDNNRGKSGPDAPTDASVTGLAVDTTGPQDVVSVGFSQSFPKAPKGSPLTDGAVDVAVSTNGGSTFGPPVNLNSFTHVTLPVGGVNYPLIMANFFGAPFLAAHGGVIEAVAGSGTPSSVKIPGASNSYVPMPQLVARSIDQGHTWSVQALGPPVFTGAGAGTGMGWTPKGGPSGTFVAAYAATAASATSSGVENIVVQRSTDGGKTWTDPVNISDSDPALQATSFYPQVGVAPNGRVDIVFEDSRNQANYHFQVYASSSADGGNSWTHNVQVTDQPIDFNRGVSFNSDIRQPPGVASANQYAAYGWADPRLANPANENQDDYAAVAQFAALPAQNSRVWPTVAAGFGGLAFAGLVIIVFLASRRRRDGAVPAESGARGQATAEVGNP